MRFFINKDGTIPENDGFQFLIVLNDKVFGDVDLADWPNLYYCYLMLSEDEIAILMNNIETGFFLEVFLPADVTVS